jgi:clan AA aspartic protease (TIGR02281 family)
MERIGIRAGAAVLGAVFVVMPHGTSKFGESFAVTFLCTDPSGGSIFTDSPSQLENCKPLTGSPGPGAGESTPPKVNSTAVPGKPDGALSSMPGAALGGAASPIAVPVTRVGRSLVVHARLNDTRDARLIVDTGADITVLSNEVARDLGLSGGASGVMLNTAGGAVRAEMAKVNSISVGNARVFNVAVAIHNLPDAASGVNGLLGLSFLDKFLVTLDMEKGELMLRPRE